MQLDHPKIGCIIQGNVRRGTNLVLEHIPKHFDYTVFSTWDDETNIPKGDFEVLLNSKPLVPGYGNRNFQRYNVARGLDAVKKAGCDFVLKWRSDMLPTKLSVKQLLDWAKFSPPENAQSRIVMPAFRNLCVNPDVFSSVPDLFAFGHVDEMIKLWGDEGFDYSKNWNVTPEYLAHFKGTPEQDTFLDPYCPEAELYGIYRSRLIQSTGLNLTHKTIAEEYCRLIDYRDLGILFFDSQSGFRNIGQAWEHPWCTEKEWLTKSIQSRPYRYDSSDLMGRIRRKISRWKMRSELKLQEKIWRNQFPNTTLT
jgi:hypothetical protein